MQRIFQLQQVMPQCQVLEQAENGQKPATRGGREFSPLRKLSNFDDMVNRIIIITNNRGFSYSADTVNAAILTTSEKETSHIRVDGKWKPVLLSSLVR